MFSGKIQPGKTHLCLHISSLSSDSHWWWMCLMISTPPCYVWSLSSRCSPKWWTVVLPDLHQMIFSMCYLEHGILSRLLWWSRELRAWLSGPGCGFTRKFLYVSLWRTRLLPVLVIPFWTDVTTVPWNTGVLFCCFSVTFPSWCFLGRFSTFVSVLPWGRQNSDWLTPKLMLQESWHSSWERNMLLCKVLFLPEDWEKLYLERYISGAYVLHLADHRFQFGRLKSSSELKNYALSLKHMKNLCLGICKLSAAQRIFLTLKQGLHEHSLFLSMVIVSLCK